MKKPFAIMNSQEKTLSNFSSAQEAIVGLCRLTVSEPWSTASRFRVVNKTCGHVIAFAKPDEFGDWHITIRRNRLWADVSMKTKSSEC